jgi:hypothetical protein
LSIPSVGRSGFLGVELLDIKQSFEYLDVKIPLPNGGTQVVQAFRKELNDLRQRDIERSANARLPAVTRSRRHVAVGLAAALRRIADRLEPNPELDTATARITVVDR